MIKVRILECCEFCDGEAYVFVSEDVDSRGETHDRLKPRPTGDTYSISH